MSVVRRTNSNAKRFDIRWFADGKMTKVPDLTAADLRETLWNLKVGEVLEIERKS